VNFNGGQATGNQALAPAISASFTGSMRLLLPELEGNHAFG